MCDTCNCCDPDSPVTISRPGETEKGDHGHSRTVDVELDVLARNVEQANRNRAYFERENILALNLVSSPGSGKTSILERTITDLHDQLEFSVIEGDQQTLNDAERIKKTGVEAVQINTGTGCHLDAEMIHGALHKLPINSDSVLFIENVGNLVCPAMFDLGEATKVVIISVTEGEDKPEKYPHMFAAAGLCLINKTDLLPYLDFDVEACRNSALRINPKLEFIEVSAKDGSGMSEWYSWLKAR
jgi:hydrogenase nickel incorporation protein HypB